MKQLILLLGLFPSITKVLKVRAQLLGLLLFLGISSSTFAVTNTYTGATGGNWNVASNWSSGALPISTEDVVINGKTVLIEAGDVFTINRLSLQTSTTAVGILNITGGNLTINQTAGTASNDACYLQGGTINNSGGTVSITNAITSATGAGIRFGTSAGTFKASSTFNNAGTGTLSVSTPTSNNGTPCIIMNQNDAGYHPTFTVGGTITITPNSGSATMAIECASPVGAIINGTGTLTAGTTGSPVIYTFIRCQAGNSATLSATIETGVTLNYFGSNSCIYAVSGGTTVANSTTITNKGTINVGGTTRFPIYILCTNTLSGVASTFDNQGTITANGAFSTGNSGVIYMAGAGYLNSFTNSGTINFNTTVDQTTECNVIRVSGTNVNASISNSGTITVGSNKALTNAIVLGDSKSSLTNTGTINLSAGKVTGTSGTGYSGSAVFNNNAGGVINTSKTDQASAFTGTIALTNNGTINYNFPNIAGNVNLSTFGDCSSCDLAVSNGGELIIDTSKTLKTLNIAGGGKVTNASSTATTLTILGNFTINSDVNGTGTYVEMNNGNISLGGIISVNQSLQNSEALRTWYLTPPVSSTTPIGMSIIRSYDEPTYTWSSSLTTMNAKVGYQVNPALDTNDISFSGTLNNGNQNITLSSRAGTDNKAGFNLIGNPYPSYLDWTLVTANAANTALMRSTTMWYRTKSSGAYYFWTVNGDGVSSPNGASSKIPPMQAFWVRANAGGGTLALTNAMRSHAPATDKLLKAPATKNEANTLVRLQVSNETNTDEAVLYFSANASNGMDTYDAPKMSNDNVAIPEIYTTVGAEHMVINAMNTIPLDTPIGLGFVAGNATSFSLTANEISNLPTDVKVILKDNVTNTETNLTDGVSTYQFCPVVRSFDRFSVIFRSAGAVTSVETPQDNSILVYCNSPQQLTVMCNDKLHVGSMLTVYNAIGQKLMSQQLTSTSTQIAGFFASGVYMVKVNNTTKKAIVN